MEKKRYYGYDTKVYAADVRGHDVALEFDKKLLVLNRARLFVDGERVDDESVFYGDKTLTGPLGDGTTVTVRIDSGMVGELTSAQARRPDGSWIDLVERVSS